MVYLDADNELEPYGALNLQQMLEAGGNDQVQVLVLWDGETGNYGFPKGSRIYRLSNGILKPLADWGELDMGDPQNLVRFVDYAAQRYPAQHYGVILWNYGGGWRDGETPRYGKNFHTSRNICWDASSGNSITLPELRESFAAISAGLGQNVDLVGFDASLMGMMEVAFELKDSCRIMASSEEDEPETGWPYNRILKAIYQAPDKAAANLGEIICNAYLAEYAEGSGVTFSVLNLEKAEEVFPTLNNLALKLQTVAEPTQTYLGQLASQAYHFFDRDFLDLRDLARLIKDDQGLNNQDLKTAAAAVFEALTPGTDRFVLERGYRNPAKGIEDTGGVSIYYPSPAWGSTYDPNYNQLDMSKETYWPEAPQIQENLAWVKSWGGPLDDGWMAAVASDSLNNIYCTGYTNSFGAGNRDIFVLKYNALGELIRQKTWGGAGNDYPRSILTDPDDNLFISGVTSSFGAEADEAYLSPLQDELNGGAGDFLLLKYDADGNLLWQKIWGGPQNETEPTLTRDQAGNIYILGSTRSFGAGDRDFALLKCNSQGELLWARTWGGPGYDFAGDVFAFGDNAVYAAGFTDSFGQGNYDCVLLKYDGQGNLLWQKVWGTSDFDIAAAGWQDSQGNLYMANRHRDGDLQNVLIMKYDPDGNVLWARTWGTELLDVAAKVWGDGQGKIFVTGWSQGMESGKHNLLLLTYDTDGNLLGQRVWQSDSYGMWITGSASGNLLLGGVVCNPYQGGWVETHFPNETLTGTTITPAGVTTIPAADFEPVEGIVTTPDGSQTYAGMQDFLFLNLGK